MELPEPALSYFSPNTEHSKPHLADSATGKILCGDNATFGLEWGFGKRVEVEKFLEEFKRKANCIACSKVALKKYSNWLKSLPEDKAI